MTESSETFQEMVEGLTRTVKCVPPKYLYDERGSELFEEICRLPSYYPTRTETRILEDNAAAIARLIGEDALVIEPGSGAATKVRILLRELRKRRYVPVEISQEILLRTCDELLLDFPGIEVYPVCADFTADFALPEKVEKLSGKRVIFFPGSTIGNLEPEEARRFLARARELAGPGGGLLIGVDRKKDPLILHRAYNDPEGVTAEFNLNLLRRINRETGADFRLAHFRHQAVYNAVLGRVEMHLVSTRDQSVRLAQEEIRFYRGESIHTESSYKYTVDEFADLGERAGLRALRHWEDATGLFSVFYFAGA